MNPELERLEKKCFREMNRCSTMDGEAEIVKSVIGEAFEAGQKSKDDINENFLKRSLEMAVKQARLEERKRVLDEVEKEYDMWGRTCLEIRFSIEEWQALRKRLEGERW